MTAENEGSKRPQSRRRAERVRTVAPILEILKHARETLRRLQRRAAKTTSKPKTGRMERPSESTESAGGSEG